MKTYIVVMTILFSVLMLSCSDMMDSMKDRKLSPGRFDVDRFNESKFSQ